MSAAVQKWGKWTCISIIDACIRAPEKPSNSLSARRFCGGAVRLQGQSIGHEPAPPRCSASTAQPLAAPQKWGTPPASSECGSSRRPSPSLPPGIGSAARGTAGRKSRTSVLTPRQTSSPSLSSLNAEIVTGLLRGKTPPERRPRACGAGRRVGPGWREWQRC